MRELTLKYGCNPNQKPARIFINDGELPIEIINGNVGYINFLDALNGYQLVNQLKKITGFPAAASFKHVSPAGVALGYPLTDVEKKMYFVENANLSKIALAYARARGADRLCSYGDFVSLSDTCDEDTANLLLDEVSDGIIAPDYTQGAIEILKKKRKGNYNIIKIDENYVPKKMELRDVFGITFEQGYNDIEITYDMIKNIVTDNKDLTKEASVDMIVALVTLKYTQSNSVCYVKNGQTIGIGAGQQSRIHCTRLAGDKADNWFLRQHPKVLELEFLDELKRPERDNMIDVYISGELDDILKDGVWQNTFKSKPQILTESEKKEWILKNTDVTVGSDAFFPFGDNVERAKKSGVKYIVQTGGSIRDDHVIMTANKYNMVMSFTGVRFFHH